MGTPYTVRPRDTLSGIAQRHGYASWRDIYFHDENETFRAANPNPNIIREGSVLSLPDRDADAEEAPAEPEEPEAGAPSGGSRPPSPAPAAASRRTTPDASPTVLNSQYEMREIVVAQGIEHLNTNPWLQPPAGSGTHGYRIPRGLQEHLPDNDEHEWVRIDDQSAEFLSHAQRVRYRIRVISTKNGYRDALQTQGLHVVYMGHSRYGRGQCFAPTPNPGDNWEEGTDPAGTVASSRRTGLFRTGYPIVAVHFTELDEHGYRFNPVPATVTVSSGSLHPDVSRRNLHRVALAESLRNRLLPQALPAAERYWASRDGEGETLLLYAGWENTASDPMDLGATEIRCRCWCIFSCSTRHHYWRIVRRMKNHRRTENEGFAYFTTATSYPLTAWAWLRALFEYSEPSGHQSWYRSLEWAKRRATQIIRREGEHYGIY